MQAVSPKKSSCTKSKWIALVAKLAQYLMGLSVILHHEAPYLAQRPSWSASLILCNWFFREHGNAITDEIDQAYNGIGDSSPTWIMAQKLISADLKCEALDEVISIISSSYPTCPLISAVVKKASAGKEAS